LEEDMTVLDEKAPAVPVPAPASARPVIGRIVQVCTALAAIAAVTLGVLWAVSLSSGDGYLAAERDEVLGAAQQAAVTLNTLDYRNAPAGMDAWMAASTGQLQDEFRKRRDDYVKLVTNFKRVTTAKCTDLAVTELDDRAGVARVIAGVDVVVTPDGQKQVLTRQRLQLEMNRTPDGWKVGRLAPVRNPGAAAS
jgi:Mce-associated membrane protein